MSSQRDFAGFTQCSPRYACVRPKEEESNHISSMHTWVALDTPSWLELSRPLDWDWWVGGSDSSSLSSSSFWSGEKDHSRASTKVWFKHLKHRKEVGGSKYIVRACVRACPCLLLCALMLGGMCARACLRVRVYFYVRLYSWVPRGHVCITNHSTMGHVFLTIQTVIMLPVHWLNVRI